MPTRNQEVDKTFQDHDKAVADLQSTLSALLQQQEQSIKQQEQIVKAFQDQADVGSGSGSRHHSRPPPLFSDMEQRGGSRQMRMGKIEFPRFSGEEVEAWLYRCEHFFTIDETPETCVFGTR